jgi:hypothetical protein
MLPNDYSQNPAIEHYVDTALHVILKWANFLSDTFVGFE